MAYIGNSPTNIVRGRRAVYQYTATSGQTQFSGVDDNGLTLDLLESNENDVYLNGSRLVLTDDYTVSGDVLTLTSGAATGDILIVVTQDEIANAASYTKAEADSRYINYDGDIVNGDIQVVGNLSVGSGNLTFGDNDKAIFGSGSDLQIYHTGTDTRIDDVGTGDLRIRGTNVRLQDSSGYDFVYCLDTGNGGQVNLLHNASTKLATTSTGIDVTGTVTAGINGNIQLYDANLRADSTLYVGTTDASGGALQLYTDDKNRMLLANNGDISFYEDTGTTAKLFWDASDERLTIGTYGAPENTNADLHIRSSVPFIEMTDIEGGYGRIYLSNGSMLFDADHGNTQSDTFMAFRVDDTERMRIDADKHVLIGTTTSNGGTYGAALQVKGDGSVGPDSSIALMSANDEVAGRFHLNSSGSNSLSIGADPDNLRSSTTLKLQVDGTDKITAYSGDTVQINAKETILNDVSFWSQAFAITTNTSLSTRVRVTLSNYASVYIRVMAQRTNGGNSVSYWEGVINNNNNANYINMWNERNSNPSYTFDYSTTGVFQWTFPGSSSSASGTVIVQEIRGGGVPQIFDV